MQLRPEELATRGYLLKDKLNHQELIPFVREGLRYKTWAGTAYTGLNVLFFALVLGWLGFHYWQKTYPFGDAFLRVSYGMALAFALIPLHEFLHVLAYKYVGAPHTSYDANLRKFYFMAMADQFVVNRQEFRIVALTPFVVITGVSLLLLAWVPLAWQFTLLGMVLTHAAFCSGDFGLLGYFEYHQDQGMVTYDDKAEGMSYFYILPGGPSETE
ncbi:MAG: DUF3267 domain-containing protein [Lewinellaceae bacterium]|nr:DUF3267 domain-containing protein [Lewinellaceae bacterium]